MEYPSSDTENPHQTHILFSWLLGHANNAKIHLEAEILYQYLLGHSGSPLRHALETAEFAASISPLTMMDDSGREIRITTGIVTDDAKYADETEALIFDVFEKILENGVPTDEAEGILDQIEMSLRELGTGYPYGLSLMLQAIGAATHDESLKNMIDPSELLDEMREKIKNPKYLADLLRENFVENVHRTRVVAIPSQKAVEVEQNLEKKYLKKIESTLDSGEKEKIRENAKKLEESQKTPQDMNLLPKIAMPDIPREMKSVSGREEISANHVHYSVATNNLNYVNQFFPLQNFTRAELPIFSLVTSLIGELGFGDLSYTEAQKIISQKMNFSASWTLYRKYGEKNLHGYFSASAKFLERNTAEAMNIFEKALKTAKFHETEQMKNIFNEKLLTMKSALTSSGNATAMRRASHGHTLAANISEKIGGIDALSTLKNFLKKSDAEMVEISENLYQKALQNNAWTLTIAKENFVKNEENVTSTAGEFLSENFEPFRTNEAWLTDLAVGYCALAVKVVPIEHEDAPLFVLLGQFLRDGFLHTAIREQGGAYGSGAGYDAESESFRFFSYRDPRIQGTFEDFENSIRWLLENDHAEERLDEAKIGVIAKIDTPSSPAKEALADAILRLRGYTKETQNRNRTKILDATIDDLKRIAREYLSDLTSASRVVITGKQNREECEKMGFEITELD